MSDIGKGYFANFFFIVLLGLGVFCPRLAFGDVCSDGVAFPPFVAKGVDSNLLMIIDNSASMYDLAYVPDTAAEQGYCFDKSYDDAKTYTGYFNTNTSEVERYFYNQATGQFEETTATDAQNLCDNATGTKYDNSYLCITINTAPNPDVVTAFAAKGNFLNWAAASKFDAEKKVLTGGKYDSGQLIMESRGCMDKTFIKRVPVLNHTDSSTDQLTLGIVSEAETGVSNYLTRIEIYKVTDKGFEEGNCEGAIDLFSSGAAISDGTTSDGGGVGTIKTATSNCLDPQGLGLSASQTSFNHIMQECWYFNAHGNWQPGSGTVNSLKSDCQQVYNITGTGSLPSPPLPDPATYLAQYSPAVQNSTDVCYGKYGTADGYVGRCWEGYYSGGGITCSDNACTPFTNKPTEALTDPNNDPHTAARFCDSISKKWIYCNGNYNSVNDKCTGSPGLWTVEQVCTGVGTLTLVDWTDDVDGTFIESGYFEKADDCVDQSLQKWCANLNVPEVVDPTDSMSADGTTYNVPAILMDSAVHSQLGNPLLTMKGLVAKGSTPTGLLHDYQGSIRMGAMAFNDGTGLAECAPVEQPAGSGRYVASLYDCLFDKGTDINADSDPDPDKRDGGRIVSYIGKGTSHTNQLVSAINDMEATTWTPTAEAYYNALGYYTQDSTNRLDLDDYLLNSDDGGPDYPATITAGPYPAWQDNHYYDPSDWTADPPNVTIVSDGSGNLYWTDDGGTSSQYLPDGVTSASDVGDDRDVVWNSFDPVTATCQKNNILIITDGATTADQNANLVSLATGAAAWDEGVADSPYACGALAGSTLLDDLTYYGFNASITDGSGNPMNIRTYLVSTGTLRDVEICEIDQATNECKKDLNGNPIYTKPVECDSDKLLTNAAKNGYDTDAVSGNPLGELHKAEDPSQLYYQLRKIFTDIRSGAASGSAASVISSSRSGEGAIYQALFFTSQVDSNFNEIDWAGDIHSLWLDKYGNIREDCGDPSACGNPCDASCDSDQVLDLSVDNIISFYTDSATGSMALARRFSDANGDGKYQDKACSVITETTEADCVAASGTWDYSFSPDFLEDGVRLQEIKYLWSGGDKLAEASPTSQRTYNSTSQERYIFTHDGTGTSIPFTATDLANAFGADPLTGYPYIGYLNAASTGDADAIVNYIRGLDQAYRSRYIDWDEDGNDETYKLGDVVHSTPTIVSRPAEDYDVIYKDDSYRLFRKKYEKRRTVIYAGGNDGGLHAFNGGYFDRQNNLFLKAPSASETQYELGMEMWMFIPYNLLPHLNCLTNTNYDAGSHKYFVDLKPKIFDAKIFNPADGIHEGGWGTVLVGGMRFGGADTGVDTDPSAAGYEHTLRSAYFILDITDPECPPVILAEFTDQDLGFTTSYPTAIPMVKCDIYESDSSDPDYCGTDWPMNWYLAFGSGPHDASDPQTAIEGRSDQTAKLFVLKLGGTNSSDYVYSTSPEPVPAGTCPSMITSKHPPSLVTGYPKELAYCSDPAFTDETSCTSGSGTWEEFPHSFFGDFITVDFDLSFQADTLYVGSTADTDLPLNDHTGAMHRFVIDDVDNPATWHFSTMLNVGQPVTAAPAAAYDGHNFWLYFGTGRFYTKDDRSTTTQQSFYGVKEQDSSGAFDLDEPSGGELVNVTNASVEDGGQTLYGAPFPITKGGILIGTLTVTTFKDLLNAMTSYDGWKINFDPTGERNLGQAAVLGDIVTFTTYEPSADLCAEEGDSYLWAPYYKTGTAYSRSIIGLDPLSPTIVLRKTSLGKGLSTTPNIHSGKGEEGSKAFVQTSTGAIIGIEQANPGVTKSGPISWRNLIGE